jgi:hypothetical protein
MRGDELPDEPLFSYVSLAQRVPQDHPLRPIRGLADTALAALSGEFDKLYSKVGRPSIPPEQLLRALLLRIFFHRSEQLLVSSWLQPAVSLVRRADDGQLGVGCDGVQQEPGAAPGR